MSETNVKTCIHQASNDFQIILFISILPLEIIITPFVIDHQLTS